MSEEKKNQNEQSQQAPQAQQGQQEQGQRPEPFDVDQSLDMDVLEQVSGGHKRPL